MTELAQALMAEGLITRAQVDDLNSRRALTGESLDRLLLREGLVSETQLLTHLAALTNIPFRPIAEFKVTHDLVSKVPARVALRYRVAPAVLSGGVLTLAVNQVPPIMLGDNLRVMLGLAIDWVLCSESDILKTIKYFYGLGAETVDGFDEQSAPLETEIRGQDVSEESEASEAGMIKFVNQIISEAIRREATDIHLEPFENRLRLRYRIDGILQEVPLPRGIQRFRKAVSSCVKIMADLDIAERRKPHDGRIQVRYGSEEFDLRVSILPTPYGETVDMRILNRKTMFIDLEHLGMTAEQAPKLESLVTLPHGVILITGPTGSGKTTTLYAVLSRLNTTGVKIITAEDPIEYQMDGISQIQVNTKIDLTFASILRSMLRHNPDIILVGEIRDSETADIAVRASLTGHLVFSTLHTNDAPSAITRLIDMGVEPYLVSSCLEGVIAQRLVRRICTACREPVTPDDTVLAEIARFYPNDVASGKFFVGRGCPDCNFTGYHGRIALFEMMLMDDVIRSMVVHQRPSNEIRHKALERGFTTLRHDGWKRVLSGMTTVEEVLRVTRRVETV
jgi:type II secretory ATPase GspE/PulE/Tfp pilus assembly ATPase PilB-like protein